MLSYEYEMPDQPVAPTTPSSPGQQGGPSETSWTEFRPQVSHAEIHLRRGPFFIWLKELKKLLTKPTQNIPVFQYFTRTWQKYLSVLTYWSQMLFLEEDKTRYPCLRKQLG